MVILVSAVKVEAEIKLRVVIFEVELYAQLETI
jgi:hypothetical protein